MKKNLTIKLEERIIKRGRHIAIEEDKSLSQWVAEILAAEIIKRESRASVRKSALNFLRQGFALGGKPMSRDDVHER